MAVCSDQRERAIERTPAAGPSFALEVVSQDWEKDYVEVPARYDELGVRELLVFDPNFDEHPDGVRWQVFRQVSKRGLVRVEASHADRVRSKVLGCWFRAVGEGRGTRIRIAVGTRGDDLVPTPEEAERNAKEVERAAKEAERSAKEAALARVRQLEAELLRVTGRSPRRAR